MSERRLRSRRDLSAMTSGKRAVEEACEAIGTVLNQHNADTTFALLYLLNDDRTKVFV